jgi:hypothetical protein
LGNTHCDRKGIGNLDSTSEGFCEDDCRSGRHCGINSFEAGFSGVHLSSQVFRSQLSCIFNDRGRYFHFDQAGACVNNCNFRARDSGDHSNRAKRGTCLIDKSLNAGGSSCKSGTADWSAKFINKDGRRTMPL